MKELELEKIKLKDTIQKVEKKLIKENDDTEYMIKNFVGTRDELWGWLNREKIKIKNLESSLLNPYFSRIDFKKNNSDEINSYYIGKHGISYEGNQVVIDWRAPIASLYYDSNVGECSYQSPSGEIKGNLNLKRQFQIENGELLNYFDVDLVMSDDLLQKYLNENNDSRLKNIVSTIQKEQNEVIRDTIANNIIVQGVAGSGKTTVALHRIAYLVYNYSNSIRQNQYLVIGPNSIFLNYIKSVLPDLEVDDVKQYTFQDFALKYINCNIKVNSETKKINSNIVGKLNNDIDKFKSSFKYKEMIDLFLKDYYINLTSRDLMINDFKLLDKEFIKEQMDIFIDSEYSLSSKIDLVINRLSDYILYNIDSIILKYNNYVHYILENVSDDELEKTRNKLMKVKAEIEKGGKSILRKYFSKSKIDVTKIYKSFISAIEKYNIYNYNDIKSLKRDTLANLKNNSCDFTDLSPMVYICCAMNSKKEFQNIKQVVVDEAQDLGEFNFEVLKKVLPNATFSIFGDLAQSICDYKGIDNWNDIKTNVFADNCKIINFNKSYRTTSQIMEVADEIASNIGYTKSDVVIRQGENVSFNKVDKDSIPDYIINRIEDYKSKGYKTIGIISKTDLLSSYLNDDLYFKNYIIPNVSSNDDISSNKFNICTISNQLSKGLEFDCVIVADADEKMYSSNNKLDMKLLYVAITRALHAVDVIYVDELNKTLKKFVNKDKVKKYKL